MNVLAVCAGLGGLELGIAAAVPGARTVGYIEKNTHPASVLVGRMEEAALDQAPIWSDVATFDGRPWRGVVDCIAAGFPCQPFSIAGKKDGIDDERWIWPHIERIIRDVEPRCVFLENVSGLLGKHGGMGSVLASLATLGFDAEWDVFSAEEVGAPHLRNRVYILAVANPQDDQWWEGISDDTEQAGAIRGGRPSLDSDSVANSLRISRSESDPRLGAYPREVSRALAGRNSLLPPFPPALDDYDAWARVLADVPMVEPSVCGVADELPDRLVRVDQLYDLGNGAVPAVAAYAWKVLAARFAYSE